MAPCLYLDFDGVLHPNNLQKGQARRLATTLTDHRSNTATSGAAPQRKGRTDVPTPLETYRRQPGTS